jgi:hypothetical protein
VRPADIAHLIVPHRGDVNSSPTLGAAQPQYVAAFIFDREYVSALGTVARAQAKEETVWERKENFWESQISALKRTLVWYRLREKVLWSKATKAVT